MRACIKKLKSSRGETLTETLASLLIIVLAMTMLAGSIVSAARVNRKVKDSDTSFKTDSVQPSTGTVSVTHKNAGPDSVAVSVYTTKDSNGYMYYEIAAAQP